MDPIKINGGPPPVSKPPGEDSGESQVKSSETTQKSSEAVAFKKSETAMHKAFQTAVDTVEEATAAHVSDVRQQILDGTYEPDLMVVAERLLADLMAGTEE